MPIPTIQATVKNAAQGKAVSTATSSPTASSNKKQPKIGGPKIKRQRTTPIMNSTPFMNRSLLGVRNLNQVLQTALNPGDGGPEVLRFGWTFRIGDRVIQTENDYNRDVFNGDLGVIEKINRIEQDMVVNFEGPQVEYDFGDLDELALAYVLSIHKSQGSECRGTTTTPRMPSSGLPTTGRTPLAL